MGGGWTQTCQCLKSQLHRVKTDSLISKTEDSWEYTVFITQSISWKTHVKDNVPHLPFLYKTCSLLPHFPHNFKFSQQTNKPPVMSNISSSFTLSQSQQQHLLEKLDVFKVEGRDKRGRNVLLIIGKYFPGTFLVLFLQVFWPFFFLIMFFLIGVL